MKYIIQSLLVSIAKIRMYQHKYTSEYSVAHEYTTAFLYDPEFMNHKKDRKPKRAVIEIIDRNQQEFLTFYYLRGNLV